MTLIEVIIGVSLLLIMGAIILKLTVWRSASQADADTVQQAQNASFSAFNALSGKLPQLANGGSFEPSANDNLKLSSCTRESCDFIVEPVGEASATSIAGGVTWQSNYAAPDNARILFLRRWHSSVFNGDLKLYKLTVAVFKDENATAPLSYETKYIYAE